MKRIIVLILLVTFFNGTAIAKDETPKVYLEHGVALDSWFCPTESSITDQQLAALNNLIPTLQKSWDKESSNLLTTVSSLLNRNFEVGRKEVTVNLILCATLSSMSYPLLINIQKFVPSTTMQSYPVWYFTSVLFHELLHRFIYYHYRTMDSALLTKYKHEERTVLQHLHLLSLMKYVYLTNHKNRELELIIKLDSNSSNPSYKRAWEIVNNIERYEIFIAELLSN